MKKGTLLILMIVVLLILAALGAWMGLRPPQTDRFYGSVMGSLSVSEPDNLYKRVVEPRQFEFPADFESHPDFQTEWWYYTGNLNADNGDHFGYQLTFFRRAVTGKAVPKGSKWRTRQVFFAHFAISDVARNKFYSFERFSRGALDLAGAQGEPYKIWLEDWRVYLENGEVVMQAADGKIEIDLRLKSVKPEVLQGDRGLSQKGPQVGNASYYFSQTRLATRGSIRVGDQVSNVTGFSWFDKEWGTSALNRGDRGWDWFAIQLDDQRELMLYQFRTATGESSPYSSGSYVNPSGISTSLSNSEFTITPTADWKSPHTGIVYPSAWQINIPSHELSLTVVPYMKDQEHLHSFVYWEGAVKVTAGKVNGNGYAELTGYGPE